MITGVHHTGLVVRDLDAAIAFYATCGSFRELYRFDLADTPEHRTLLQVGNAAARVALLAGTLGCIELFEFAATRGTAPARGEVPASGIRHVCLQTALGQEPYTALLAAGATSHAPPAGLGTGNSYVYIRDPEGNLLELEGVPWGPAVARPWYAHTAIVTSDLTRLSAFYEWLTGAKVHRRASFGPHAKFDLVAGIAGVRFEGAWLRLRNAELELWQYHEPASLPVQRRIMSEPGWNHLCLETDDIDADYRRLQDAGVDLHGPPARLGEAEAVFGRDPDGNVFELLRPVSTSRITVAGYLDEREGQAVEHARAAVRRELA